MPTVVGPVVRAVSTRAQYAAYVTPRNGFPCDVEIGGVRFLYDPSADTPMSRRTADYKKQQFDNESEPGEQTLTGWWLRSQPSFHGGAGVLYQENYGYDNTFKYAPTIRFRDSQGVNPWVEGQVSLLSEVDKVLNSTGTPVARGALDGTTPVVFMADGMSLSRFDGTTNTAVTAGNTGTILDLAVSASSYFVADASGIYQGTLSGGTGTKLWNLTSATSAKLGWVKQRLVAGVNNSLYELVTGAPTLPSPLYTHPSSLWTWTSIVAGPAAIYASGYAGGSSSILAFQLTSTGTMPVLTSAVTVAELPQGEIVQSLFSYLGTFLVIGTNKGVRVGTVDPASGTVTYGPLTITSTNGSVRDLVGQDRFVYATATSGLPDGSSGLWRVDLGTEVADGRFAYATDLCATGTTGRVRSVTLLGDQLAFTVDNAGLYLQHATNLVQTGWIRTGRIRYRTLEPKLFKYVRLRTNPLSGTIGIGVITDSDSEVDIATLASPGETDHNDCALPGNLGGQESVALKFTLSRNTNTVDTGPVLRSFQLKSLPGTKRQRELILPLLCYDYEEQPGMGQRFGYIGYARDRLMALEAIENTGDAVVFQDFQGGTVHADLVVIDQLQFDQSFPPERAHGLGGRLIAVLRTII